MYFGEALSFSLQALWANKFRTFLTALGLVIGNASVILVVTISITSREYILDLIRGVGSNLIYAQYSSGTNNATKVDADFIKMADVDAVRQQLGSRLVAATGVMSNSGRMLVNGKEEDVSVIGTDQALSNGSEHGAAFGTFRRWRRCEKPPARGDAHRKAGDRSSSAMYRMPWGR